MFVNPNDACKSLPELHGNFKNIMHSSNVGDTSQNIDFCQKPNGNLLVAVNQRCKSMIINTNTHMDSQIDLENPMCTSKDCCNKYFIYRANCNLNESNQSSITRLNSNKDKFKFKITDTNEKLKRIHPVRFFGLKKKSTKGSDFTRHSSINSEKHRSHKKSDNLSLKKLENLEKSSELDSIYLAPKDSSAQTQSSAKTLTNSLESVSAKSPHSMLNTVDIVNAAVASITKTDETLQQLIDIVMPPLLISSNFDLTKTNDVAELSAIMHQHLNTAVTNSDIDFSSLGVKRSLSANENNEIIMRNCLDYFEYLNKKHTRERRLRVLQNKISGVIFLAIVFVVVFGLGFFLTVYLVNSLI